MPNTQPSLFARDDTFFGVCEGLGQDLGVPSNLLRLAFALALFFNPVATLAAYAAAGLVVLVSRWLIPNPRIAAAQSGTPVREPTPAEADASAEQYPLPLAA